MSVFKALIIFTLVFAILSIVIVQNGDTRYYTPLLTVKEVIVREFQFSFTRLKDSMDDLKVVFKKMEKAYELNFSPDDLILDDTLYDPELEGLEPNSAPLFDSDSTLKRIFDYIKSLFGFLIDVLPLMFELTYNLIFFLIALLSDGVSFITSVFTVFWTLLFPAGVTV